MVKKKLVRSIFCYGCFTNTLLPFKYTSQYKDVAKDLGNVSLIERAIFKSYGYDLTGPRKVMNWST